MSAAEATLLAVTSLAAKRVDRALALVEGAIRNEPEHARAYAVRGAILTSRGDYEAARADLERALELGLTVASYEAAARTNLAKVHDSLGDHEAAIGQARRALELAPDHVPAHELLARVLVNVSREDEALDAITIGLAQGPNWELYSHGAAALINLGQLPQAEDWARRAVELSHRKASPRAILGAALVRLRRYEEALPELDKSLALEPDNPNGLHYRAGALINMGRPAEALADCDRFFRLGQDPKSAPEVEGLRAMALAQLGRHDEALLAAERCLSLDAHEELGVRAHAQALFALGRVEEAVEEFARWWELAPSPLSNLSYAQAQAAAGRAEEALTRLDRQVERSPTDRELRLVRGRFLLGLERYSEARGDYDVFLQTTPHHLQARLHRALLLARSGQAEDAIADAEVAAELDPGSHLPLVRKGEALVALGRHVEALPVLDEVVRRNPGADWARCLRARCYRALGDRERALREYRDALGLQQGQSPLWERVQGEYESLRGE